MSRPRSCRTGRLLATGSDVDAGLGAACAAAAAEIRAGRYRIETRVREPYVGPRVWLTPEGGATRALREVCVVDGATALPPDGSAMPHASFADALDMPFVRDDERADAFLSIRAVVASLGLVDPDTRILATSPTPWGPAAYRKAIPGGPLGSVTIPRFHGLGPAGSLLPILCSVSFEERLEGHVRLEPVTVTCVDADMPDPVETLRILAALRDGRA